MDNQCLSAWVSINRSATMLLATADAALKAGERNLAMLFIDAVYAIYSGDEEEPVILTDIVVTDRYTEVIKSDHYALVNAVCAPGQAL